MKYSGASDRSATALKERIRGMEGKSRLMAKQTEEYTKRLSARIAGCDAADGWI